MGSEADLNFFSIIFWKKLLNFSWLAESFTHCFPPYPMLLLRVSRPTIGPVPSLKANLGFTEYLKGITNLVSFITPQFTGEDTEAQGC